ncbi:hypothetical protein [Ottowia sp. VDI28]|uniref:hypothetical protein n=1 Tax=Ottowia sp. VDI28 TaxID=3133968 RepID=UPI003C2EC774
MAKTTTSPFLQAVKNLDGTLTNANGTAKVTVFTAGANDSVLKSFNLASTDSAANNVQVFINVGGAGTDRLISTVPVPANSGNNGTVASVDVLRSALLPFASYDAYGNRVLNLAAGTTIKIAPLTTPASGKVIDAFGEGGDF